MTKAEELEKKYEYEFFAKHSPENCEIITTKEGKPLAAVYLTPLGHHQEFVKNVFKRVAYSTDQRTQREGE
jgi:hypothetical protein